MIVSLDPASLILASSLSGSVSFAAIRNPEASSRIW